MKQEEGATDRLTATLPRVAWAVSFVIPIALLALLWLAVPARTAVSVPGDPVVDTTINAGPAEGSTISESAPSFQFSATLDGEPFPAAIFHCSLDGAPPTPCSSPRQVGPLADGPHSFSVYAEDEASGARDETPATRGFTVESAVEEEPECAEEGGEGAEGCEEEAAETSPFPPDECLLRTARARVFAYTSKDKVRLVIHYTSLSPAKVTVGYRMKGKRGPLALGRAKRRFAKKGLFRLAEKLSPAKMRKVRAAGGFTVAMRIPAAPRYCNRYYSRHLTIKRTVKNQVVWFQSDSIFGT